MDFYVLHSHCQFTTLFYIYNMPYQLKAEIIQSLKDDPILFGHVADSLSISPFTLPDVIRKNSSRLTEFGCLQTISSILHKKHIDLVCPTNLETIGQ